VDPTDGTYDYDGRVAVLVGGSGTGNVAITDADGVWRGPNSYDYLGETVGGGDLDGDGRDDLVIGAWGDDTGATSGGAYYVVEGSATIPTGSTIASVYDTKFYGHIANRRIGSGAEPVVADLDGDGNLDLAIGAWEDPRVYVFSAAGSSSGAVSTATADVTIDGPTTPTMFGLGLASGDFDKDGTDDLAVGAPDDDTASPSSGGATTVGAVYLFDVGALGATADETDAMGSITGSSATDGFGQSLASDDLDADGDDELLIDAPGVGSDAGRVYFVSF
jgi:hypothetical protein